MWKFLKKIRSVIIGLGISGIIASCATTSTNFELIKDPELDRYKQFILTEIKKHCTKDEYYGDTPMIVGFSKEGQIGSSIAVTRTSLNMFFIPKSFKLSFEPDYWAMSNHEDKMQLMAHEMMHALFQEDDWYDENNRHHFMFWTQSYLPLDTVMVQLQDFLEEKCND